MDGLAERVAVELSLAALDVASWPVWLLRLLAVYGLFLLLYGLWEHTRELLAARRGDPAVSILVVTRDQEQVIEGVLRELVARYGSPARARTPTPAGHATRSHEIVVVDDSSTDDTPLIIRRLARDYPGFIRVTPASDPAAARPGPHPGREDPVGRGASLCRGGAVVLFDLRRADTVCLLRRRGHPGSAPVKRICAPKREPHQESGA